MYFPLTDVSLSIIMSKSTEVGLVLDYRVQPAKYGGAQKGDKDYTASIIGRHHSDMLVSLGQRSETKFTMSRKNS